ncbi:MAG: DUF4177 domain-containing protein [Candidatus Yanofskybacteria bacterium]|nr:DUF4177 domain-containing protein [Candidatus Yanofskybacteria bacterium]
MRAYSKGTITKWEYKAVCLGYSSGARADQQLNFWGEEGWELVSISAHTAYLKRSKGTYRKEV